MRFWLAAGLAAMAVPAAAADWVQLTGPYDYDAQSVRYHAGRDGIVVDKRRRSETPDAPDLTYRMFIPCEGYFNAWQFPTSDGGRWRGPHLVDEMDRVYLERVCTLGRKGVIAQYDGPSPPQ